MLAPDNRIKTVMGWNDFISKIIGNKAQRDIKEIEPVVKRVKAAYGEIEKLSNDELRARTKELEKRIQEYVSDEKAQIAQLKESIESIDLDKRETIWNQVDKLEKEVTEKYEKVLDEVLPEAFSIMKDTARRFTQNSEIVVTATDFEIGRASCRERV